MLLPSFILLASLFFPLATTQDYPPCFSTGQTWDSQTNTVHVIDGAKGDAFLCQHLCTEFQGPIWRCEGWTFYEESQGGSYRYCFHFETTSNPVACDGCVSGPEVCEKCSEQVECAIREDTVVQFIPGVRDEIACQTACLFTSGCGYYTYHGSIGSYFPSLYDCFLFSDCVEKSDAEDGVWTGPADCEVLPTSPPVVSTTTPSPDTGLDCSTPPLPQSGDWFCVQKSDGITCSLECDPGFVPSYRSVTSCSSDTWTVFPASMTCEGAVVLLAGGRSMELFGLGGLHKALPDLPDLREGHTVEYVDSHVVLCGGISSTYYYEIGRSCMQLTPRLTWTPISYMNTKREQHSSVTLLDALIILGGGWSSLSTEVNIPTSEWSEWMVATDMEEDSHKSCAVKVSATEYVVIGGSLHQSPLISVVKYNVLTGLYSHLPSLPTPMEYPGCARINNPTTGQAVIVAAGGYAGDTLIYTMETETWKVVGRMVNWVEGGVTQMVCLEGRLFAFISGSREIQEFDFVSEVWIISEETLLDSREIFSVTSVPSNYLDY